MFSPEFLGKKGNELMIVYICLNRKRKKDQPTNRLV